MTEIALGLMVVAIALIAWLAFRVAGLQRRLDELPPAVGRGWKSGIARCWSICTTGSRSRATA